MNNDIERILVSEQDIKKSYRDSGKYFGGL